MPDLRVPPLPFDSARVARTLEALAERGFASGPESRPLLEGIFGNSAFLSRLALREPEILSRIFAAGPQTVLQDVLARARDVASCDEEAIAMAELRAAKRGA